eukprot:UN33710
MLMVCFMTACLINAIIFIYQLFNGHSMDGTKSAQFNQAAYSNALLIFGQLYFIICFCVMGKKFAQQ